jgi:hypothetical protein
MEGRVVNAGVADQQRKAGIQWTGVDLVDEVERS